MSKTHETIVIKSDTHLLGIKQDISHILAVLNGLTKQLEMKYQAVRDYEKRTGKDNDQ